jgi:hypothetical protein
MFKFLADHVVATVTYRLSHQDLQRLEIVAKTVY